MNMNVLSRVMGYVRLCWCEVVMCVRMLYDGM